MIALLLALLSPAEAAPQGGVFAGVAELHFNRIASWDEPFIGAYGEPIKYTYVQVPWAEALLAVPGFYLDMNWGGLIGYLTTPFRETEFTGQRASRLHDSDLFRMYVGPTVGEEVGFGFAVGYSAGATGVTHTEISSSGFGNVMWGGLGGKLINYVILGEALGLHTHVGSEALMTKDGKFFDGFSFTVEEYVLLNVSEGWGFYLHPGFRYRDTPIGYDKEQKQRMTTFMLGFGIMIL